jgi:hypothetical protein
VIRSHRINLWAARADAARSAAKSPKSINGEGPAAPPPPPGQNGAVWGVEGRADVGPRSAAVVACATDAVGGEGERVIADAAVPAGAGVVGAA